MGKQTRNTYRGMPALCNDIYSVSKVLNFVCYPRCLFVGIDVCPIKAFHRQANPTEKKVTYKRVLSSPLIFQMIRDPSHRTHVIRRVLLASQRKWCGGCPAESLAAIVLRCRFSLSGLICLASFIVVDVSVSNILLLFVPHRCIGEAFEGSTREIGYNRKAQRGNPAQGRRSDSYLTFVCTVLNRGQSDDCPTTKPIGDEDRRTSRQQSRRCNHADYSPTGLAPTGRIRPLSETRKTRKISLRIRRIFHKELSNPKSNQARYGFDHRLA